MRPRTCPTTIAIGAERATTASTAQNVLFVPGEIATTTRLSTNAAIVAAMT
jgi:hypothetical protein